MNPCSRMSMLLSCSDATTNLGGTLIYMLQNEVMHFWGAEGFGWTISWVEQITTLISKHAFILELSVKT